MLARALRRLLSLLVSIAMVVALSGNAPAALAAAEPGDDPEVAALKDFVDKVGPWTAGLATVGKLAEQIPTVGASAGSMFGFPDLVQRSVAAELVGKHSLDDIVGGSGSRDIDFDLGDGRSGTLHVSSTGDADLRTVTFDLDVTVEDTNKPFVFANESPKFSLSSSGGVKVAATGNLTFGIGLERTGATFRPFLVGGADAPKFSLDVVGTIKPTATLKAAIGILGVDVTEGSVGEDADAADISVHLRGGVKDPDSDGRLYFTDPDGSAGELSGDGSLAGLVTTGFRPAAAGGAGKVDLDLHATASADGSLNLPGVSVGAKITWNDISAGTPTVALTNVGSIEDFLRITPRDLADMLGQLVSVITAAQRNNGENLDLPFLSGTLADAVKGSEGLVQFLIDNVVQPPTTPNSTTDPTQVGMPKFVSIQDLFAKLKAYKGNATVGDLQFGLSTTGYAASTHRLPFDLTMSRAASAPIDLVKPTVAAAGTGAYASNGFVSSVDLGSDLVGRRVVAGAAGGTIKAVAGDKRTVELTQDWVGGTPADGTAFTVSGPSVDAGAVSLANLLSASGGEAIRNANAVLPTATVTPDYRVTLKLALDLRAPATGTACDPDCPYQRDNGDGSKTLVTEQPLPVDRLLVGTGYDLLAADFPLDAGIDVYAKAGFLGVRLGGHVRVCSSDSSAGADCTGTVAGSAPPMVAVKLEAKESDPSDGFVPIPAFFQSLVTKPTERLSVATNIRGYAGGSVSVPGAEQFLPNGASAKFTVTWPKVGTGTPSVDVSDLSEVLAFDVDPSNPQAMLGLVLRALQLLDKELAADGGSDLLGTEIPVVNRSLRDFLGADQSGGGLTVTYGTDTIPASGDIPAKDVTTLTDTSRTDGTGGKPDRRFPADLKGRSVLIGTQVALVRDVAANGTKLVLTDKLPAQPGNGTPYFLRSELADAVSLLTAAPPDSLQELISVLDRRLGADSPVHFRAATVDGKQSLVIDLDWKKGYDTSSPVKFDVGGQSFAGASGSGTALAAISAEVDAGLVLPLDVSQVSQVGLKILKDSHVSVDARGEVTGDIGANVGPLSLSLGDPSDPAKDAVVKAHYSLGFNGPSGGDDEAQSLTAFLSGVAPTVNGYTDGVDCGLNDPAPTGDHTRDPLALCASLPLYTSINGSDWDEFLSPGITMRLPKNGATVAELFLPSGTVSATDERNRLDAPTPEQIQAAFQSALLDFGVMGQGIDAFLNMIETALHEAAMEGKLPVVGGDLQAGADFVGKLREKLDALFVDLEKVNGGKLPDVGQINDFLDDKFNEALRSAGADPKNFDLDVTCTLRPSDVTKAEAAGGAVTDTGTTTYTYAVAAVGKFNGADVATKIGATASVEKRPATLSTDDYNHVEWKAVPGATTYKLLRSTTGAAPWTEVYQGDALNHDDKANGGSPFTEPDRLATVDQCDGVALPDVQGVVLRVDIGSGKVTGNNGCEDVADSACLTKQIPLDVGVPGLSVRAKRDGGGGGLQAKLGWRIHLAMELSRDHGFAILTKDTAVPEFGVGLNVDLTDEILAELAFLRVHASKADASAPPAFAGAFQLDLRSGTGEASCFGAVGEPAGACDINPDKRLGLAELTAAAGLTDVVVPRLSLNLHVNWLLKADVADSALPGVQTRLVMDWAVALLDPGAADGTGLSIAFKDVSIDAGKFLSSVLGPVVTEIKKITGPVQPVIDTLYTPIPVLSDLSKLAGGGDVTIVTLAKTFSTVAGGPKLDFVDTVAGVITFVNNLPTATGSNLLIPIGSFDVLGKAAFSTPATPDTAASLINAASRTYKKKTGPDSYADTSNPGEVQLASTIDSKSDKPSLTSQTSGQPSVAAKAGFKFPVLDNPGSLFNLVMGGDVDLVTFDSGPLTLGFSWRQSFGPVYAPPPVFITMSGSASVTANIQAGFDTYGLRKAVEGGFDSVGDVAQILNGLYFKSADQNGNPLPVVTFYGEIAAGAAVSAVVITVGVEGGLSLTINMAWNDPNNDGKFRLFEFGVVAMRNPLCLFQMSGRIGIFLRVYITLGVSPFSVSFDFTLADITLLDFSVKPNCDPPPPRLAGLTGDKETLIVFAGKFGKGERGDSAWSNNGTDDDTVQVTALHDLEGDGHLTGAKVTMLGITETFEAPNLKRVVVDGSSGYTGTLKVTMLGDGQPVTDTAPGSVPTGQFDLDAIVLGGSGDDTIRTGRGSSWVDGGAGKDVITTDDQPGRTVLIAGGPGDDSVKVADAGATAAGDSGLAFSPRTLDVTAANGATVSIAGIADWSATVTGPSDAEGSGDGKDRVAVGLGRNTVYGNGADDAVGVASDSDLAQIDTANADRWRAKPNTIVLGSGNDSAQGGSNDDTIWTGPRTGAARDTLDGAHGVDEPGASDGGASRNTVNTGAGKDTVFGSDAADLVTGGSSTTQADHFRGGAGDDVLIGGLGDDALFGGPGRDWVVAEPGQVSDSQGTDDFGVARTYSHAALPAGTTASSKLLVGGDGADHVVGGDGASRLFGDRYETDPCGTPATTPVSTQPDEPTAGSPGRDLILGGTGIDKVKAGGAADLVKASGSNDLLCGQDGADEIYAADGADTVWGGSGDDRAYGDTGADLVFGNDGADQLYGGDASDVIEGNDGADRAFGGAHDDLVAGGTRAAGKRDKGTDQLYGEDGDDVVIGDNARDVTGQVRYPLDLDGTDDTAGDGDIVSGGAGADHVYGGLFGDSVSGDAGNDALEGNNGEDTGSGGDGSDDIVGGSSETTASGAGRPDARDVLRGGADDDVITGDNARIVRATAGNGDPVTKARAMTERSVTLHDLAFDDTASRYGGDDIAGGMHNDVLYGQNGADTVHGDDGDDYAEGGQGTDDVNGDAGEDDLVGGSWVKHGGSDESTVGQLDTGDRIRGGAGGDVVLGDNGLVARVSGTLTAHPLTQDRSITERFVQPYDLAAATASAVRWGDDVITGEAGVDVVLAQSGNDRVLSGTESDYAEGGSGVDWLEGGDGSDDLIGGSSTRTGNATGLLTDGQPDAGDVVWGQAGDDLATGDNALVTRSGRDPLTDRVSEAGRRIDGRTIQLYDVGTPLSEPVGTRFGADDLSGQGGVDVLLGQDGADRISGGGDDDYAEGQGGADSVSGDEPLADVPTAGWPGEASASYDEDGSPDGQDDLLGGWSRTGFRDASDTVHGDGEADFVLGDNGSVRRDITDAVTDRLYLERYAPGAVPADAVKVRIAGTGQLSTRFCSTAQLTCEPAAASGGDALFGDGGDDTAYGQDGDDRVRGGTGADDLYGELGDDRLLGEDGDDAIVGDRGGIRDVYEEGTASTTAEVTSPPAITYTSRRAGSLSRVVDLLHDVNGDRFVGKGTDAPMTYDGVSTSDPDLADGNDVIRGGAGHDSLHGGHGDDLVNGDSGGDTVFGGDGADVLWGGKGCDPALDAQTADCLRDGQFDAAARGSGDRMVDYLFGGKGAIEGPSLADGGYGPDILDWRPRGDAAACTSAQWPVTVGDQTSDPCAWFEMTNLDNGDDADNQHHQGIDWQYGGWDRDVLQADEAGNGPNDGDRLLDWNGAYNLYTHCNSAYGGFNDVRLHSPSLQGFLQVWAYGVGAGQTTSDVTTPGTSAYDELALVYNPDNKHASGPAFASTPGHFDAPNSCSSP